MSYEYSSQQVTIAAVALATPADNLIFSPAVPVEIISFGYIITVTMTDAAGDGFVAKLDKRITAASDTGRTDGTLGTLTLTNAQTILQTAGKVIRSRPVPNSSGEAALVVLPGQQAVLELTNGSVAGNGIPFIEYKILPRIENTTVETIVLT